MREIEVKVRAGSRESVLERLKAQNIATTEAVTQHDQVFGLPDQAGDDENTAPWLRIRTETKKGSVRTLFTLKRSITNQLDSIEHETEVSDPEEMTAIIAQLGFVPYSDITKTRQTAKIGDIELCIDSVKRLGDFVEVEKMTDEAADYREAVAELWSVLELLGFTKDDEVTDGYDVLVNAQAGV